MNTQEGLRLLDSEFIFYSSWVGLQELYGGNPVPGAKYDAQLRNLVRICQNMYEAGAKIHTFYLSTGWKAPGVFDYTETDRILKAFFEACPDALLIPRITSFDPTPEWERAYPDDLYLFENAKDSTTEEIRSYVGRYQDVGSGYDGSGQRIGHQSFASLRWQTDALDALGRIIEHLEASPYADRILGYHVGYGNFGETHFWGSGPDYSKANRSAFYAFGLKKYGSVPAMEAAWNTGHITPENVPLPGSAHMFPKSVSLSAFRHEEDALYRDYSEYSEELSYHLVHSFAKTIKDRVDKVVGIFHGYLTYSGANHHGQTDYARVLDDPNIDFMAAPKNYYRADLGEPGGSHSVPMSANRKMRWVEEVDNRSHLAADAHIYAGTKTAEEFCRVMRREFARCEAAGSPFWWMDQGIDQPWYDDKALLDEIRELYAIKKKLSLRRGKSRAQILLVLDEHCATYITQDIRFYYRTMQDTIYETALIGAPYDFYRMDDLETLDLSRYKLVIFLDAVGMTPERFRKLDFAENARFLWNFMPGGSFGEAEAICGMKLRETGHGDGFPLLAIDSAEGLEVIHTYADPTLDIQADKAPFAFPPYTMEHSDNPYRVQDLPDGSLIRTARLGRHYVCTVPSLDRFAIRALAEDAGCSFDAEVGTAVYADDRFTAYMSADRADIVLNEGHL